MRGVRCPVDAVFVMVAASQVPTHYIPPSGSCRKALLGGASTDCGSNYFYAELHPATLRLVKSALLAILILILILIVGIGLS